MSEKTYLVLAQYRKESEYNDFIGNYYHFPQKYLQLFSANTEFVYFEPHKKGEGVYYGYGKTGLIFPDKKNNGYYYIEIRDYNTFSKEVPFLKDGKPRERAPHYNAQNSVRLITSDQLEEICLDGGIQLNFIADANLIRVLGEQLIATENVGILELVKNAYDAGASYCKVRIENIPYLKRTFADTLYPELAGPVIIIDDDGNGMDIDTIKNGWLRPASPIKTSIKERIRNEREKADNNNTLALYDSFIKQLKKEHGGRIPLGEKGVGRLATHRLGNSLEIHTKIKEKNYEYVLKIDWDKFDELHEGNYTNLDSIGLTLTRCKLTRDYGDNNSGTRLIIYGGRDNFTLDQEKILDIYKTLKFLRSPYTDKISKFNIIFECPQISDLKDEEFTLIDEYPSIFTIEGTVNRKGIFTYKYAFNPPNDIPMNKENEENIELDLKKANKDYWKTNGKFRMPECGRFNVKINAWYRSRPWIGGPEWKRFTEYLDNYGGISVFRDELMIYPAERATQSDWLDLSKRHIKKGLRISYYNLVGSINITQSDNIDLIDKTDREGLIGNKSFNDLKVLMQAIVTQALEIPFKGKREDYDKLTTGLIREPKLLAQKTKAASKIFDNLVEHYNFAKDPLTLLEHIEDIGDRKEYLINLKSSLANLNKSLKLMQEVQDLLTEQAGFGLSIGVAVHEIAKLTSNFYNGVIQLLKSDKIDRVKLEDLKDASLSLKSELNRLAPQRAIRNEKPFTFNIRKSIEFELEVYKRKLNKGIIDIEILGTDFNVHARYGAINQVISNLIDNSIYWVDTTSSDAKNILIKLNKSDRTVLIADSGPGIHEAILPYLFEPGYSMKVPPSGLGLYICRYYLKNMRGDIYLAREKDRLRKYSGAQFILDFSRVPEEEGE